MAIEGQDAPQAQVTTDGLPPATSSTTEPGKEYTQRKTPQFSADTKRIWEQAHMLANISQIAFHSGHVLYTLWKIPFFQEQLINAFKHYDELRPPSSIYPITTERFEALFVKADEEITKDYPPPSPHESPIAQAVRRSRRVLPMNENPELEIFRQNLLNSARINGKDNIEPIDVLKAMLLEPVSLDNGSIAAGILYEFMGVRRNDLANRLKAA